MIRKYHNHKLQTNLWYREEEPHNNHETPGRQTMQSLPAKALRMLVETRGLPSDSPCVLQAEPGTLDIKRSKPGILIISLQADSLFKLEIMTLLSSFVLIQCH